MSVSGDTVYCRDCGSEIAARAEICPECGIRQQPPDTDDSGTDAGIAAAASFVIPGLGQVVNGEVTKGIALGVLTVGLALTGIGLILAIPIWLWLVYDAYRTADGSETTASTEVEIRPFSAAVVEALDWFVGHEETTGGERIRERFRSADRTIALTDDEISTLLTVIDTYQDQVESRPDLDEARQAFVRELN